MQINKIDTLLSFAKYLENDQFSKTNCKVLALDFDQTLVKAKSYFGSENWYQFLNSELKNKNKMANSQHKWAMKLLNDVPYETCETAEKINALIKKFREQGWFVVILTARPLSAADATMKHIAATNLSFSKDDIIFKDPSSAKKRDCLHEWLKKQSRWKDTTELTVLFADDNLPNCENVSTLAEIVHRKVKVDCFHYQGAVTSSDINQHQLKNFAVQLAAYKNKMNIPADSEVSEEALKQALKTMSAVELSQDILFENTLAVAGTSGFSIS